MVREFSKYGKYEKIIRKLVLNDNVKHCTTLYTTLNKFTSKVSMTYVSNFWKAHDKISSVTNPVVFVTKIKLYDQSKKKEDGFHAVALLKEDGRTYMFDPNGILTNRENYLYVTPQGVMNGSKFSKIFDVMVPKKRGIQYIMPGLENIPPGYINAGGYCMFYLFIGLANILQKYETKNESIISLCIKITDTSKKKLLETFPTDIHIETLNILKYIFKV